MDFYQQQSQARRQSRVLITIYLVGMLALGLITSLWLSLIFLPVGLSHSSDPQLFHSGRFWMIVTLVMLIGLFVTFCRYQSLRKGGWRVAKALGGRRLLPNPTDFKEQQLRNVVEEMAIASGMPVPAIYVQDEEPGINSFAAGMGINDAVIVVTRGALEALDRDELQAIIAHEFSHIRNGDILLNTRLAAAMTGLLMIAELAELLHYDLDQQSSTRLNLTSHNTGKSSAIATGFRVLGYGGVFFGELLKAAVNRQRETLADASAVQFTRHPEALARALKKVAGHPYASLMFHPNSRTFSHLFFAQGLDSTFAGLLATHPVLADRIRQLEPDWDGMYIRGSVGMTRGEYLETSDLPVQQRPDPNHTTLAMPSGQEIALADIDLDAPHEWLPLIPPALIGAAHQLEQASLVLCSLLLSTDLAIRHRQITQHPQGEAVDALTRYPLPTRLRLGLVELCLPTLQLLDDAERQALDQQLAQLVAADGETSLFEWLLLRVVRHQLPASQGSPASAPMTARKLDAVQTELQLLGSAVAHFVASKTSPAEPFFAHFWQTLELPVEPLLPRPSFTQLDQALDHLQRAAPGVRLRLVQALARTMEQDGVVSDNEFELFRTLALCLDCPVPPPQPGKHHL